MKRDAKNCPCCNGWVISNGMWRRHRYTINLVCPMCKTDYDITPKRRKR